VIHQVRNVEELAVTEPEIHQTIEDAVKQYNEARARGLLVVDLERKESADKFTRSYTGPRGAFTATASSIIGIHYIFWLLPSSGYSSLTPSSCRRRYQRAREETYWSDRALLP